MIRKFVILWLFSCVAALAQNPQSQQAPIFAANAKYTNGTAPGYAPCGNGETNCSSVTGLSLQIGPGTANCSGTIVEYAGGILTLPASSTNYVYLNSSASCTPATKTTAFVSSDIPIAKIVTGASSITTFDDVRTPFFVPSSGGGGTPASPNLSVQFNNGGVFGAAQVGGHLQNDSILQTTGGNILNAGGTVSGTTGTSCFGDSNMAEFGLPSYPGLSPDGTCLGLANDLSGGVYTNYGTSGSNVADGTDIVFGVFPTVPDYGNTINIMQYGTNNAREEQNCINAGTCANWHLEFRETFEAMIDWIATSSTYKTLASVFTQTGTWTSPQQVAIAKGLSYPGYGYNAGDTLQINCSSGTGPVLTISATSNLVVPITAWSNLSGTSLTLTVQNLYTVPRVGTLISLSGFTVTPALNSVANASVVSVLGQTFTVSFTQTPGSNTESGTSTTANGIGSSHITGYGSGCPASTYPFQTYTTTAITGTGAGALVNVFISGTTPLTSSTIGDTAYYMVTIPQNGILDFWYAKYSTGGGAFSVGTNLNGTLQDDISGQTNISNVVIGEGSFSYPVQGALAHFHGLTPGPQTITVTHVSAGTVGFYGIGLPPNNILRGSTGPNLTMSGIIPQQIQGTSQDAVIAGWISTYNTLENQAYQEARNDGLPVVFFLPKLDGNLDFTSTTPTVINGQSVIAPNCTANTTPPLHLNGGFGCGQDHLKQQFEYYSQAFGVGNTVLANANNIQANMPQQTSLGQGVIGNGLGVIGAGSDFAPGLWVLSKNGSFAGYDMFTPGIVTQYGGGLPANGYDTDLVAPSNYAQGIDTYATNPTSQAGVVRQVGYGANAWELFGQSAATSGADASSNAIVFYAPEWNGSASSNIPLFQCFYRHSRPAGISSPLFACNFASTQATGTQQYSITGSTGSGYQFNLGTTASAANNVITLGTPTNSAGWNPNGVSGTPMMGASTTPIVSAPCIGTNSSGQVGAGTCSLPAGTQYQQLTYNASNVGVAVNGYDSGAPSLSYNSGVNARYGFTMPTSGWAYEKVFDDSYGVGVGTAVPSSTTLGGYAYQLNAAVGSPTLTNYSAGGYSSCDIARTQVFPNVNNGATGVGLQLFGDAINDYHLSNSSGPSNPYQYLAITKRCWEAEATLLASNLSNFAIPGTGFTGTNWSNDTTFSSTAGPLFLQTSTASATATATIPGTAVAGQSIVFWYRIYNYSATGANSQNANFSYQLDGTNYSFNVSAMAETPILTGASTTDSLGVIFIRGVTAGSHTVTFKASSTLLGTDVISIGPVGYGPQPYSTGTGWASTGSVCTFTAANTLVAGQTFYPQSFATTTALNSSTPLTALSTGLSSSQVEANCTQASGSGTESFVLQYGPPIQGQPIAFTREVAYTGNDNLLGTTSSQKKNYSQTGDYYNDEMSGWLWEMQNIYGFTNIFQAKIRNFYKATLAETSNIVTATTLHPNTLGYKNITNAYMAPLSLNRPPKLNHDARRDWASFRYLSSSYTVGTSFLGWDDEAVTIASAFGANTLYLPIPPQDVEYPNFPTVTPGFGHTFFFNNLSTNVLTLAVFPGQVSSSVLNGLVLPNQTAICQNTINQNYKCSTTGKGTLFNASTLPLPTCTSSLTIVPGFYVSDATTPTYLGTYSGGGSTYAPVMCNGTNWVTY